MLLKINCVEVEKPDTHSSMPNELIAVKTTNFLFVLNSFVISIHGIQVVFKCLSTGISELTADDMIALNKP